MSYEEVGIRLRADGGVETSKGVNLVGAALDTLAGKAAGAVGGLDDIAPAARQATAALGPVGVAVGSVAAAAAVATAAFVQGRREQDAYLRGILLTGNAAGVTTGQLQAMAGQVDAVIGTQAQAAEVLARLVSTGEVSRAQLTTATEATIALQRDLGVETGKAVAAFAALGKDPVKAAAKLNEEYRYLTLSTWEQIRALAAQGRTAEASAVAQEAFAKSAIGRAKEMESNLGTLERGWRAITSTAKEAWDAMLGLGRQETVEKRLADVQARLAAPLRRGVDPTQQQARREALRQQEAELQELLRIQQRTAGAQAATAAAVEAQVKKDTAKGERPGASKREQADHYRALNEQIERRLALASAELAAGGQLTAAERAQVELESSIAAKQKDIGIVAAEVARQRAQDIVRLLQLTEEQNRATAEQAALEREFKQERAQAIQQAEREVQAIAAQRDALRSETEEIGLNAFAIAQRRDAQTDATIAAKEARLERIAGLPAYEEEATALRQQIQLLNDMRGAYSGKAAAQQRQTDRQDNERRTQELASSIEQGFMNGFRNGQSLGRIFLNELKAQFARQVLRVPIQFVANQVGEGINALMQFFNAMGGGSSTTVGTMAGGGSSTVGMSVHGGGIAGQKTASSVYRTLPASAWAGAPRYHSGAIAGDEVPAVLRRKEGVFTVEQMKSLAPVDRGRQQGPGTVILSPSIQIDARTDKAEVFGLVMRAMEASKASYQDDLERRLR